MEASDSSTTMIDAREAFIACVLMRPSWNAPKCPETPKGTTQCALERVRQAAHRRPLGAAVALGANPIRCDARVDRGGRRGLDEAIRAADVDVARLAAPASKRLAHHCRVDAPVEVGWPDLLAARGRGNELEVVLRRVRRQQLVPEDDLAGG